MAATAHPLATQIAVDVLKQGGSAVDAAIAANAALGLMEPTGCGIGGDLFALVYDPKTRRVVGLNASGRSPRGRSLDELKTKLEGKKKIPAYGSLAVTVPGAVDGWFRLHERFGKLSIAEVLAPAIDYAERGFPVTQLIAHYWALNFERWKSHPDKKWLEENKNAQATFLVDGEPPREGQTFRNPDLAATYRSLVDGGRDAFYKGPIATRIDAYMLRIGGDLRKSDLEAHEGEWVEPAFVDYRGHRVFEIGPNTQGLAALQMLKILEGYDLANMSEADRVHVEIEAKRLAFEDRARFYADPATATLPIAELISDAYADARRTLINMNKARSVVEAGDPLAHGDTTYLTVADESGMMVSLIQSNYRGMGSGLVPDGLGFMLQDRGELFALDEEHANVYAPGKRPFHTIIPAMVTKDGEPWLSFGVMGGAMQPQGHVQVLVNLIDLGMNVQEAGDAPRHRHGGSSQPTGEPADGAGKVFLERGLAHLEPELSRRGHDVVVKPGGFGGYQAILRIADGTPHGTYFGGSEMRKDGAAMGY